MSASIEPALASPHAGIGGIAPRAARARLGRYELRARLGRSARSEVWRAFDAQADGEVLLVLPRLLLAGAAARDWLAQARRAARLDHPHLAPPLDIGVHERQPFIAAALAQTLPESMLANGAPSHGDAARWSAELLNALAYAHEAGFAHRDLQPYLVVIDDRSRVRLLGLGALPASDGDGRATRDDGARATRDDAGTRATRDEGMRATRDEGMRATRDEGMRATRDEAERDVLAAGVLLYRLLAGRDALDEPDIGRVVDRLAPLGSETLRLPRVTPQPLPAPLRAIVDRALGARVALRYRNARTLQRALDAWREAHERADGGPVARLLERIAAIGHLPAQPGVVARAARLARMERVRTHELAKVVLEDIALSFELLRLVNSVRVQAAQAASNGPVLALRRAIALLGVDNVRHAATGLREWPGPLAAEAADAMQALIERVRLAARVAVAIRPAGYDAEVAFLVALLQNLGRLLVQYHFADEAQQMRELMQPAGMSEADAAGAVLGIETDAFAAALARQWGLSDEVTLLMRRLDPARPVRRTSRDDELLRATASCANEAVDALALPAAQREQAIEHVAGRYAKLLKIEPRDLFKALRIEAKGKGDEPDPGTGRNA